MTHELGHALGLGESDNTTSAMSGTLATGTVIRTLIATDLNIPYDEGPADAQRVAVPPISVVAVPPVGTVPGSSAGGSAASGQGVTITSSTIASLVGLTPPAQSGSSLSPVDQVFADLGRLWNDVGNARQVGASSSMDAILAADLARLLSDMSNAYQSGLSSLLVQWQNANALAQQHLDDLLSMQAGALGTLKDALIHDLFITGLPSSNEA